MLGVALNFRYLKEKSFSFSSAIDDEEGADTDNEYECIRKSRFLFCFVLFCFVFLN